MRALDNTEIAIVSGGVRDNPLTYIIDFAYLIGMSYSGGKLVREGAVMLKGDTSLNFASSMIGGAMGGLLAVYTMDAILSYMQYYHPSQNKP